MENEHVVQPHFAVVSPEHEQFVRVNESGGVAPATTRCLTLGAHYGPLARLAVVRVHVVEQTRLIAAANEHEPLRQGRARVTTARIGYGAGSEWCTPCHGVCSALVVLTISVALYAPRSSTCKSLQKFLPSEPPKAYNLLPIGTNECPARALDTPVVMG